MYDLSRWERAPLAVLDALFDAVALLAPPDWRIVYANSALEQWLQRAGNQLRGEGLDSIFHRKSLARVTQILQRACEPATNASNRSPIELSLEDECLGPTQLRVCHVQFGELALVAIILRPLHSHSAILPVLPEKRDPLTGLFNREYLFAHLAAALGGERAADRDFTVLFVDLDNFKQINDEYGHLTGDNVLREVGRRLSKCVREEDRVVRYGGDEFVVVANRVSGSQEIEPLIARIQQALASPIVLPEGTFHLSLSIGAAEPMPHHRTPEDLLCEADRAMYAAKRQQGQSAKHP